MLEMVGSIPAASCLSTTCKVFYESVTHLKMLRCEHANIGGMGNVENV